MSDLTARLDTIARSRWFPVGLVLAAMGVALLSNWLVYPTYSWNRDEPVFVWQADLLRHGHLTADAGDQPEVVHPWLAGERDGKLFSQYPVGWPSVLVVADLVGWPALAPMIGSALMVLGAWALAWELTRDRRVAAIAGILLLASPILAVQGGLFLTYCFSTGLGTLFAALLLHGVRRESRWQLGLAGALLGWLLVTRVYDAVVWAAVAGGYLVLIDRARWRRLLRHAIPVALGVVPFAVLQLVHNRYLTGHALQFPMSLKDPLDKFGFGDRRLMPGLTPFAFGPRQAILGTLKNAFFTPWFLVGAYLGVVVAGYGALQRRRERSTWFLVALGLAFPVAYLPFWGVHISSLTARLSGPIYYVPAYVPLCILAAVGLVELTRRSTRLAVAAVVGLVAVTVPVGIGRLARNHELSRIQRPWQEATADLPAGSLVVVSPSRYLLFLDPWSGNGPTLDGPVLYATDGDPSLIPFLEAHPDRTAYLERATVSTVELAPSEHTDPYDVELLPLDLVHGERLAVTLRVDAPRAGPASVGIDVGGGVRWQSVPGGVAADGTVEQTWLVGSDDRIEADGGVRLPDGGTILRLYAGFGAPAQARATPTIRFDVLAQGGATSRAVLPGTLYRPSARLLAEEGEVVWDDDPNAGDVTVTVTPRPGP